MGNVVWCPSWLKDIKIVEKVQRDFTRYIVGVKHLSYQDRLQKLKLPSLEYRRLRGDMIEVYKIVHTVELRYNNNCGEGSKLAL